MKRIHFCFWSKKTKTERHLFVSHPLKIKSITDTVDAIIYDKKSLSRFGDGELRLMINKGKIVFQDGTHGLSDRLKEVLNSTLENHMVGLPKSFQTTINLKLEVKYFWLQFLNLYGNDLVPYINFDYEFADSFISRFYIDYTSKKSAKNTVEILKTIWDKQNVLIVEGEYSRIGVGNDLFDNTLSLQRILCPSENAYDFYDHILEQTKLYGKDKLILLALGPTATVLSYDLAKEKYWAIDIGHVDVEYMWMLMKAKIKVPLKGRYVSEAREIADFEIPMEYKESYLQSIVYKINLF